MEKPTYRIPKELTIANLTTKILSLDSSRAKSYGRLIESLDVSELIEVADTMTTISPESNTYVPLLQELQDSPLLPYFEELFGEMPIQIGYCNGPNQTLNGMEYHKTPELFISVTDCVQFLCRPEFLCDYNACDTSNVEAFYFPKGSVFLLDPCILHLAPCCVDSTGFKSIIILPKGTNEPFTRAHAITDAESRIAFKRNKWIIAHPDRKQLIEQGVHPGVTGDNLRINPCS